jgi:RNA polymerase sigma factor (TIGR02999 family)
MSSGLTQVFDRIRDGDAAASDQLFSLVYAELLQIARAVRFRANPAQSLQSGDLVNEAYLKLATGDAKALKKNRAYFFAAAARAMRQVLIDHGRKWRPPLTAHTPVEIVVGSTAFDVRRIHALNKALDELAEHIPELSEIVALKVFAGLTIKDVADICGIGTATVDRKFRVARAYLKSRIDEYISNDTHDDGEGLGDL